MLGWRRGTLAVVVLTAASAQTAAAATTIGVEPATSAPTDAYRCGDTHCVHFAAGGEDAGMVAPSDGVVVRWRTAFFGGDKALRVRLHTLRRTADAAVFGATGAYETVTAAGAVSFETRLPIAAGERLGLGMVRSLDAGRELFQRFTATSGGRRSEYVVEPGDAPQTFDTETVPVLAADIEPDADRDGFGDETQDDCPTLAGALVSTCPLGGAADVEAAEGAVAELQVRLTGPRVRATTVRFATEDGTATAPADFTPTSGTVTIPAGEASAVVRVPVAQDTAAEGAETFAVRFTVEGERVEDPVAEVAVRDDDAAGGTAAPITASATTTRPPCTSRRRFAARAVGTLTGARLVRAELVGLDRPVPVRRGRARVDLRGLGKGTFTLRLVGERRGRTVVQVRRLRTCTRG